MTYRFFTLFIALVMTLSLSAKDETEKNVHGIHTITIADTDDVTLAQALQQSITAARVEAMRTAFHEVISSDVITYDENINGQETSAYWENSLARINAEWISDTREPAISVDYADHKLTFTAEVWGIARRITHNLATLDLHIYNRGPEGAPRRIETLDFDHDDAISVDFSTPATGYLAIYIIDQKSNVVSCILPAADTGEGSQKVVGGRQYSFFEPAKMPMPFTMQTPYALELDQLVVIYSPNPFVKCPDIATASSRIGRCSSETFNRWLSKCRSTDKDMSVETRTITIRNSNPTAAQ